MGQTASLLLALAGGLTIAVQARVTGALKVETGDSALAAAVTFGSGLVLMVGVCLATGRNRAAVVRMVTGARHGGFPPVFMFTGLLGAYAVFGQGATVDLIGVALFSLIFIGGQMVASAVLDSRGWVPSGRTGLGPARIIGILMAFGGVVLALSLKFSGSGLQSPVDLLLPVLIVFTGGLLQPAQMAMNGVVAAHVGRTEPIVLFNYLTGTLVLVLVSWPAIAAGGLARLPLAPEDWWHYTGGLLGSVVVMGGALLTRTIGSLLYTLGLVAGQVGGALLVDTLWPLPGTLVGWQTVMGGVMTVMALAVASGRARRGPSAPPPPSSAAAGA